MRSSNDMDVTKTSMFPVNSTTCPVQIKSCNDTAVTKSTVFPINAKEQNETDPCLEERKNEEKPKKVCVMQCKMKQKIVCVQKKESNKESKGNYIKCYNSVKNKLNKTKMTEKMKKLLTNHHGLNHDCAMHFFCSSSKFSKLGLKCL